MSHTLVIEVAALGSAAAAATVIYAAEGAAPAGAGAAIWQATGLDWQTITTAAAFRGRQGQMLDLLGQGRGRLLVLGSGRAGGDSPLTAWTDRGGSLLSKLVGTRVESVDVVIDEPGASPAAVAELAAGLRLRHYRFDRYRSTRPDDPPATLQVTLRVAEPDAVRAAMADRFASVDGALLARELVHEPPNHLGPVEFAARAAQLREQGVDVEILEPEALAGLGMNAL